MRRLICAFVVLIWHKQVFSWRGSNNDYTKKQWNEMKLGIVHDYCECHRHCIFNDDILSGNICILFLSVFLSKKEKNNNNRKQKNKKNRKINTQKNCIGPESNQEPLHHQSFILPLHWCIRWGITTERVFLNNADYLNYNLYWFFNDTE